MKRERVKQLLLKSIEVQGFKSFADKILLKFGGGITAVVGPNGSGKSNISDAVRWVLGEQSTKTLRGHKMEDIIFGGTEKRRAQGFAEVTLHIDNADRSLNFDNDEVYVTRRYYRSGESEYQINKATVLLKNIHEMFMDTGLGRDGYSMIGQGKIDTIVSSKSNERRDIFEEASGISRYRYRKLEAERKLARSEENLMRLRDILAELEERVGPLKEQSEKAEKFLEYSDEKRELEIGLWLNTLSKAGETLKAQDEKIELAQKQYDEAQEYLAGMDSENEEILHAAQEINVKIDEARRLIAKIEEDTAHKEGDIAVLENTIFHNNESVGRTKEEIEMLGRTADDAKIDIENHKATAAEKEKDIKTLTMQIIAKNDELQALMQGSESFSRKIEELAANLGDISSQISNERIRMQAAESAIGEINLRGATIGDLIADAKSKESALNAELKELDSDQVRIDKELVSAGNSKSGYEMRHKTRSEAAETNTREIEALTLDIGEKERRVKILRDLEQNMEGFSGAVKRVMEESKSGALAGVHGTVSQVIKVDKKHSTAVEIALGAAIAHVVVDRDADAKRAIEFLKTNKAGRATFLPIATIKSRNLGEKGLSDIDGFVGIASELVTCDNKYSAIIENILGRTAVAEDIDAAIHIAKKYGYRFKIVTLDGQVVNAGGSLTGGSLTRSAGILGRSSETLRLTKEAQKMRGDLDNKKSELEEQGNEIAHLNREISGFDEKMRILQQDLIRIDSEKHRLALSVSDCGDTITQLESEQSGADTRLGELDKVCNEARASIKGLEDMLEKAHKDADSASGGRDENAQNRENIMNEISDIRTKISLAEKDRDNSYASAKQIESMLDDRALHIQSLNARASELIENNTSITAEIDGIKETIMKLKDNASEIEKGTQELIKQRSETEQRVNEIRASEREKSDLKEKLVGELARLTERKAAMLASHDDIIARLFDEYGMTRSEAENSGINVENPAQAKRSLDEIKGKIKRLGIVNVGAIEEYKEVSTRYEFLNTQVADVEQTKVELAKLIKNLTSKMQDLFVEGFDKINERFKVIFTELFGGGKGELLLTDPENVLESGIDIIVQPPGKKVSTIELLSGGEKALIALSIYFSIMKVNPPPFCMLDEVETALDDINVDRFAQYLRKMVDNTQFICITHRRGTMEEADMLYGVTMQEKGVSKLLELNVSEMEKNLAFVK